MTASRKPRSTTRRGANCRLALLLVIGAAWLLAPPFETSSAAWAYPSQDDVESGPLWQGPDGNPLPFRSYAEATEFLRTAQVVLSEDLGIGITGLKRLVLELDGVRARGAFHAIDKVTEGS